MSLPIEESPAVHTSRQMICLEPDLRRRLHVFRSSVGIVEKRLNAAMEEYIILEIRVERFMSREFGPKSGPLDTAGPGSKRGGKRTHPPRPEVSPSERTELKRLYRRLAKQFHPDRAAAGERDFCHSMMSEINEAFAKGDIKRLKELERRSSKVSGGAEGLLSRLEDLKLTESILTRMVGVYESRLGSLKGTLACRLMERAYGT